MALLEEKEGVSQTLSIGEIKEVKNKCRKVDRQNYVYNDKSFRCTDRTGEGLTKVTNEYGPAERAGGRQPADAECNRAGEPAAHSSA